MHQLIQVCEYATLRCNVEQNTQKQEEKGPSSTPPLDSAIVSEATFRWLLSLRKKWARKSEYTDEEESEDELVLADPHLLKIGSYVGYLRSPTGEEIEILPKIAINTNRDDVVELRGILCDMLLSALNITPRDANFATLKNNNMPLHEWIIQQFLNELEILVRKGLVHNYSPIEESSSTMRGQLDLTKQMRQPPGREHLFHIRHHIFSAQTLENKLLRTALNITLKITKNSNNWCIANNLSHQLDEIDPVSNISFAVEQMSKWRDDRLMQHYQKIKIWTQLILERLNPHFQLGNHQGIAMLFPMEKLFECYVEHHLRRTLQSKRDNQWAITSQTQSKSLINHRPFLTRQQQAWFKLKPDLLLSHIKADSGSNKIKYVLDTKWKLINAKAANGTEKYGIQQSDLYQMHAYAHKYLNGSGCVVLIYPQHEKFQHRLPVLQYSDDLRLWCIPFDLKEKRLVL